MLRALAFAAALSLCHSASSAEPLLKGLDHISVAVADLDRAKTGFEALGFVLKPGRPHANGIRNLHAKFPDGTEIEILTATRAADDLSAEYLAWLRNGDGAPFAGFYTSHMTEIASRITDLGAPTTLDDGILTFHAESLLHHLFFGGRQHSPTDRPEHFAHPNTAFGLIEVWLAEDVLADSLLHLLDMPRATERRCAPFGETAERREMQEGYVSFVRPTLAPRGSIIGATVAVGDLATAQRLLTEGRIDTERLACAPDSLWIAPDVAHGIWLEFRQKRR